jgi:hypothetical protein
VNPFADRSSRRWECSAWVPSRTTCRFRSCMASAPQVEPFPSHPLPLLGARSVIETLPNFVSPF